MCAGFCVVLSLGHIDFVLMATLVGAVGSRSQCGRLAVRNCQKLSVAEAFRPANVFRRTKATETQTEGVWERNIVNPEALLSESSKALTAYVNKLKIPSTRRRLRQSKLFGLWKR